MLSPGTANYLESMTLEKLTRTQHDSERLVARGVGVENNRAIVALCKQIKRERFGKVRSMRYEEYLADPLDDLEIADDAHAS